MNALTESARQAHEEVDLYEQAIAAILLQPDSSVRSPLLLVAAAVLKLTASSLSFSTSTGSTRTTALQTSSTASSPGRPS
jgi:hypothetical protein